MPIALIVEDEPEANKLLSMLVQLRGYRTDSAYTGGEALAKIDREPPDIVFLDLMLPDINGYEVCAALKTRKDTTLIPVVMVTARVALENRIQSYCTGADNYVAKPYTPDQIFDAMAEADDWLRRLASDGPAGEFPFESHDEGETLRRLAQLRSQLLAQTPLDLDTVCRVNESLRQLWSHADAWGRKHGVAAVASLSYRVEADRVVLSLRDLSGWFRDDPRSPAERWPEGIARGRFDDVHADPPGGTVSFVVRYPRETPQNGEGH
jgi:CheY-like chemotaxis protein